MDGRFPAVQVLVISVLATYFLVGTLATGGVVPPIGVLLLVLVLWFSVYKFRHKGLTNRELVTTMRTDLKRTLEGIEERLAQEEAQRRAAEEREEQARIERETRRANRPVRDPAVGKYASMIEDRVREDERARRGSEER
jgi:hypothetical protein